MPAQPPVCEYQRKPGRPRRLTLPVLIWLLWLGGCCGVILWLTTVTTDLTFFLPREAGLLDAVLVQQMREGPASRMLLIGIEGADDAALARTSRRLAESLRRSPLFEGVDNGSDPALLTQLENRLFAYRYALSPAMTAGRYSASGLRQMLKARYAELASPLATLQKHWLPQDPGGEWQGLLRDWLAVPGPDLREGVWFAPAGGRALLLVHTRVSGFDIDAQTEIVGLVESHFAERRESASMRLLLGGPGPLSLEANRQITRDASRLSIINSLLVMALLFAIYRSVRVVGLGLVPLATGIVSGISVTSLVFGEVHGITLGFGATLLGVAADYPNHFFTHLSGREAPASTMRRIWPTLRLGVLTNIAGFAGLLFSGFSGLAQLAVFAATGLLAAALASRWVIPAFTPERIRLPRWLAYGPGRSRRSSRLVSRLTRWLPRLRLLPLLLSAGLMLVFAFSSVPLWNDDLDALNPVPADRKRENEALQQALGAPDLRALVLVSAADEQAALRLSEDIRPLLDHLRQAGALDHYRMASSLMPSQRTQAERLATLPDRATLVAALRQAGQGLPFKAGVFQPFLNAVAQARQLPPLDRDSLRDTPLRAQVDSLLVKLNNRWVALVPLTGIHDPAAIADALKDYRERGVIYADLKEESTRLLRAYRHEAVQLLAGSVVLILVLLGLGLRSLAAVLRVFSPMLAAALCTGVIMALLSGGLNLYHLVSLLLVMGLSLDQALFFNRDAESPEDRNRTLLSLLVCSASSVLAFGTLALSEITILRAIGSTVALGALLALCFAAMLARVAPPSR
jgi:predicted exporter